MTLCLSALTANAEQWRLHPTYDGNVERIIDTPDYTYILSYSQQYIEGTQSVWRDNIKKYIQLFRYDKEGEELTALNRQNLLSENILQFGSYNPAGEYFMAVYDTGNIDMLFDSGEFANIPGLSLAGTSYSKNVNDIFFDNASDEIFVSTDFGYLSISGKTKEILYTRNLGEVVKAAGKSGGTLFLATPRGIFSGDTKMNSFSEFQQVSDMSGIKRMYPLADGKMLLWSNGESDPGIFMMTSDVGGSVAIAPLVKETIVSLEPGKEGALASGNSGMWKISGAGEITYIRKSDEDYGSVAGSWDGRDFWLSRNRDGLVSVSYADGGKVKVGPILPNASNAFKCTSIQYHPQYGMLVRNHGIDGNFASQMVPTPDLLSSYKNLEWKLRSSMRDGYDAGLAFWNPDGLAIDPNDPELVYAGSFVHGLLKLDLSDRGESLRLGRRGDSANGADNFVGVVPDMSYINFCRFAAPAFDTSGNLWTAWYDFDRNEQNPNNTLELWYWTPEDRAASKNASTFRPLKKIELPGVKVSTSSKVLPLKHSGARNMVLYASCSYGGDILLLDHKGTPEVPGDDERMKFGTLFDQDGSKVSFSYVRSLYEDRSTGLVWVGTENGLFTFRPSEMIKSGERVNRVKVSRDDGTNLADYLLNGASVNCITEDASGRKWFGTNGGGITVTSSDGTEVLNSYNTDNSQLPDNTVYAICHNPENNSMMISTDKGLVELFLSATASDGGKASVKIYPNPVRPDYFSHVKIEGVPDNALVKIVDAGGGLIKEVGFAAGGEATWDVTNLNFKRVPGGVYYVMCSGGPDSDSFSTVGKILVVN